MGRLFGTDGVRGIANTELTCELAMQIGRAAAVALTKHTNEKPILLIGRDTRMSSKMLEAALIAGICSVGADAMTIGVIPTPGVAYLVGKYQADAGVMISASHNPVEFNGIKIFNNQGYKLSDVIEQEIEALILDHPEQIPLKAGIDIGRIFTRRSAVHDYVGHIRTTIEGGLDGMRIAVDCANGSASTTAETLFKGLGAVPLIINAEPDGTNINENCGSTHMDQLIEFMKRHKCQAGVAFDGDADRCLAVDEQGTLIDGDKMLAIFADDMKTQGSLKHDTVVVTTMTNLGFFHFAKKNGIRVEATQVGDRYVLDEMLKHDYAVGGEQSGHIIFREFSSTGDGQLSAVQLLKILQQSGKKLSELASVMERFPQVMINVKADGAGKSKCMNDPVIESMVQKIQTGLGDAGRVLMRPSGTEPFVRIMVEGRQFDEINQHAVALAKLVKERLA